MFTSVYTHKTLYRTKPECHVTLKGNEGENVIVNKYIEQNCSKKKFGGDVPPGGTIYKQV